MEDFILRGRCELSSPKYVVMNPAQQKIFTTASATVVASIFLIGTALGYLVLNLT